VAELIELPQTWCLQDATRHVAGAATTGPHHDQVFGSSDQWHARVIGQRAI
jgi:hypothetical protein